MQEQIEARAGLNGSGAAQGLCEPTPAEPWSGDASRRGEGGGVAAATADPAVVAGAGRAVAPERYRLVALMRNSDLRAELKRRVTETSETYQSMGEWLGVSRGAVQSYAKKQAWPRPPTARGGHAAPAIEIATLDQNARLIRARLLQAIVRQVDKVDARLRKRDAAVDEKDSRVLANLAKTLSTLMQIEPGGTTSNHAEPPDRGDVDERLAERIKKWARGEQGY